jgi:hypothetical protein
VDPVEDDDVQDGEADAAEHFCKDKKNKEQDGEYTYLHKKL